MYLVLFHFDPVILPAEGNTPGPESRFGACNRTGSTTNYRSFRLLSLSLARRQIGSKSTGADIGAKGKDKGDGKKQTNGRTNADGRREIN